MLTPPSHLPCTRAFSCPVSPPPFLPLVRGGGMDAPRARSIAPHASSSSLCVGVVVDPTASALSRSELEARLLELVLSLVSISEGFIDEILDAARELCPSPPA